MSATLEPIKVHPGSFLVLIVIWGTMAPLVGWKAVQRAFREHMLMILVSLHAMAAPAENISPLTMRLHVFPVMKESIPILMVLLNV